MQNIIKIFAIILFFPIGNLQSQVTVQRIGNVIYQSYTFNKALSEHEKRIATELEKVIATKFDSTFPVVVLNLHYSKVRNLKFNTSYDFMEMAYQTYENEFLGGNGNIVSFNKKHLYINLSLESNHLEYLKKILNYANENLKELKEKEAKLKVKQKIHGLSDEDKSTFVISKSSLEKY